MSWIEQKIAELAGLNEKIQSEFGELAVDKMDLKPDADTWSINECLDHIVQTNRQYYDILDAIEAGKYKGGKWAKFPILPRMMGKMVLKVVSPDYKGKSKTVPIFFPAESQYGRNMTSELLEENQILAERIEKCQEEALDKTVVTSPAAGFITYSLRDCITLLVDHEKRHFNQAMKLKANLQDTA